MYVCVVIKVCSFMQMEKYIFVALSALVLTACSGGAGKAAAGGDVPEVENFEMRIVEKSLAADYLCEGDDTFGDSVELYTRTRVMMQWPEMLGRADVRPLQDTLLARCFGNGQQAVRVDEAMASYVADPVTMDDGSRLVAVDSVPEVDIDVRVLERSIDVRALSLGSRLAVFEIFGYMYGGGAHPVYSSSFVNFDVAHGRVLDFGDLVVPGREADLAGAVKAALMGQHGVTSDEQLQQQAGINAEAIDFVAQAPMFYIDGQNIVFYFNPYDIGPWVIGAVAVPVPVYTLDGIVSPEVARLLE